MLNLLLEIMRDVIPVSDVPNSCQRGRLRELLCEGWQPTAPVQTPQSLLRVTGVEIAKTPITSDTHKERRRERPQYWGSHLTLNTSDPATETFWHVLYQLYKRG